MISTRNLSPLGRVDQIKRLTQSLAVLDAIICPEWEDRYYSFDAHWGDGEMMASMRNGSGDEWYLLFTAAGAIMKGLDHESALFAFGNPRKGIYDEVPEAFQSFLDEPAFDIDNVSFCIWRTLQDSSWQVGPIAFPEGPDPDGSAHLLAILDGNPETYKAFADDYYEAAFASDAIQAVYAHQALTDNLVRKLNAQLDVKAVDSDLRQIGYRG